MPRWSPGRYAIFDFAKNVQQFQALLQRLQSPAGSSFIRDLPGQIVSLAGKPARRETWMLTLAGFKPKDCVPIVVKRDRRTIKATAGVG